MDKIIPENVKAEIKPSKYIGCEKCNYSGFVSVFRDGYEFMDTCECYRNFQLKELKNKSNIPEIYTNASFNIDKTVSFLRFVPLGYKSVNVKINNETKKKRQLEFKRPIKLDINGFGKQYIDVAEKYLKASPRTQSVGLILSGEVGSGKTLFGCAVANGFIERNLNAYYIKTKQYIDTIIDSFSKDEVVAKEAREKKEFLNGFNKNLKDNCHLLVLDELGYEYQKQDSSFALAEIKDLLRNRAEKSLPTVITTNFLLDEMASVYEEELISMFCESYMFFCVICSDDYRIKKSLELDAEFDLDSLKTK